MSTLYYEVTSTFLRDRVLEKFGTPETTLPYNINSIKVSHNDVLVADVYNNAIKKLYSNYLFLIANSEVITKVSPTSPTTSLHLSGFSSSDYSYKTSTNLTVSACESLSSVEEVFYSKKENTNDRVIFSYGPDSSLVFKVPQDLTTYTPYITNNKVEHNRNFEFSNVTTIESKDNFLFVLDKGNDTLFKFDASGLLYSDPAVERTGPNDSTQLPGRFLLKTVGGKGKINRKNKLSDPSSFSIFNNRIYILDNGNFTIKVFDLNFNFVTSFTDKKLFDYQPVSITVSQQSDISTTGKIFILGKTGKIITMTTRFTSMRVYDIFGRYTSRLKFDELSNFKKIVSSPTFKNILYVSTNRSIIKLYKTNLNIPITFYDNSKLGFNSEYEYLNSFSVDSISTNTDSLVLLSHLSSGETKYSFLNDDSLTTKLYHDVLTTTDRPNNYFTVNDIYIKSQELINSITFNKTVEKLIYNHQSLFESLHKKIYAYYTDTRVPEVCTVVESTFDLPTSFNIDSNFYIGVNEPILTDVINRPLVKLYEQQKDLFNIIKENFLNTNPPSGVGEVLLSDVNYTDIPLVRFDINESDAVITSGDSVTFKVTRDKTFQDSYVDFFTSNLVGTSTSDYGHIDYTVPSTLFFAEGVSAVNLTIPTNAFYVEVPSISNSSKSFRISLTNPVSCAIIQGSDIRTVTMNHNRINYSVSLSAMNPPRIPEGTSRTFAAIRQASIGTNYTIPISVNVYGDGYFTSTGGIAGSKTDIKPLTGDGSYNWTNGDFSPFPGAEVGQTSAYTLTGNTLVFEPGISAVFFSVSAAKDTLNENVESMALRLNQPSDFASISNYRQQFLISEETIPLTLNLTKDYTSYYMLTSESTTAHIFSGVNIWDLLSANSTYQTYSASKALDVTLNIGSNYTIWNDKSINDIDNNQGALYFDSGSVSNPMFAGSFLTINVDTGTYIIGPGGDGGNGITWLSGDYASGGDVTGFDFISTSEVEQFTTYTVDGDVYELWISNDSYGEDGGPAIVLSGFDYFSINNQGYVYGGGGGGGAGYFPVSAALFEEVSALSATGAGGGGAGYIGGSRGNKPAADFVTAAGIGNNSLLTSTFTPGSGGSLTGTNAGFTLSNFTIMQGGSGGALGQPGQPRVYRPSQPDIVGDNPGVDTSNNEYPSISADNLRRPGGLAGDAVVLNGADWYTKAADIQSGTFGGRDI